MPLTREQRKMIHQKGNQSVPSNKKPKKREGKDGDTTVRKIAGKGVVQFAKINGKWHEMSTSSS